MASFNSETEHTHSPRAICTTSSLQKRCGKYWIWQPDLQELCIFLLSTSDLNSFSALTITEGLHWMLSPPNTILSSEFSFILCLSPCYSGSTPQKAYWTTQPSQAPFPFSSHRLGLMRKILFKTISLFQEHLAHFIASVLKFLRVCGN